MFGENWRGYVIRTAFGGMLLPVGLAVAHTVCGAEHEFQPDEFVRGDIPVQRVSRWVEHHVCPNAVPPQR